MKKKPSKLSLHRETIHHLESSDLRTRAGATAQLGCDNTVNPTCKTCTCPPCLILTANTCRTDCGCTNQ